MGPPHNLRNLSNVLGPLGEYQFPSIEIDIVDPTSPLVLVDDEETESHDPYHSIGFTYSEEDKKRDLFRLPRSDRFRLPPIESLNAHYFRRFAQTQVQQAESLREEERIRKACKQMEMESCFMSFQQRRWRDQTRHAYQQFDNMFKKLKIKESLDPLPTPFVDFDVLDNFSTGILRHTDGCVYSNENNAFMHAKANHVRTNEDIFHQPMSTVFEMLKSGSFT